MSKRKPDMPKGVSYDKTHRGTKKHKARVFWNGKDRFLGRFETAEQAGVAYQQAVTLLKSSGADASADPALVQRVQALVQQTAAGAPAAAGSLNDEQQQEVASSHQTACGSGSASVPQQQRPDEITSSLRAAQTPQLSQSIMQVLDSWLDGGCQLDSLCPPAAPPQLAMQQQTVAAAASSRLAGVPLSAMQQLAASGSAATAASVDASQGQLEELLTSMLLQHGMAPQLPPQQQLQQQQQQQQQAQMQHLAHLELLLEQQLQAARLRASSISGAARASASPPPRVATPSPELGVQQQLQQQQQQQLQQLLMFQQQLQPQRSVDPLRLLLEEQLQYAGKQANTEALVRRSASASPVVAESTQHGGSSNNLDLAAAAACQPAAPLCMPAAGSGNMAARTAPDARAASPPAAAAPPPATTAAAATTAATAAPPGGSSGGSLAGLARCSDAVQMVSELSRALMQLHLALCCKCDDDAAADMMLWLFSVRQQGLAIASAASPQLQRAVLHVLSQVVSTLSMTAAPGGQGGTPQRQFVLAVLEKLSGVTLQLLQALRQHQGSSSEQDACAAATLKQKWLEQLQAEAITAAEDATVVRLAALL